MARKVRIGIDVGGTFTKAVALDNETLEIIGKAEVLTTHYASEGVAKGIIDVFGKVLKEHGIDTKDVTFIAHSTTQATNALLEGDVAPVGIVGMGKGLQRVLASSQTAIKNMEVAEGCTVCCCQEFLESSALDDRKIDEAIDDLVKKGAEVIVASEAFGVDNPENESRVEQRTIQKGLLATKASDITKLYGLTTRTKTAAINASILPKMMNTATMVEDSVRKAGIHAPLMIMRGDGGVMDVKEVRKRPILTMLSGPSASVAGALMYLKVSDGIFFEVGGTSTNIGVIKNGKPMVKYVKLGDHETFVNSLDVRVIGIAGGSMVRINGKEIVDVGPRSAHIAGLPYAAFSSSEEIVDPKVELIQPRPGDPSDYVAIATANGKKIAITNTCAANALSIPQPGDYAYGNSEASKKALLPLAEKLGMSIEETAKKILQASCTKQKKVIEDLVVEYKLDRSTTLLVGGGGGAAALIPFTAKTLGMDYKISENAEVISSIGVALALVRDMIERVIVDPTDEDLLRIRREAEELVIKAGAAPDSIEVFMEIDGTTQRVRATAIGATEMRTQDRRTDEATVEQAKVIAAQAMHVDPQTVNLLASTETMYVLGAIIKTKKLFLTFKRQAIAVVDNRGTVRLKASKGSAVQSYAGRLQNDLRVHIQSNMQATDEGRLLPNVFVLCGGRISDFSGLKTENQIVSLVCGEVRGVERNKQVALVFTET